MSDKENVGCQKSLRQIAKLLESASAQISLSLRESEKSVSDLTEAITLSAKGVREISGLNQLLGFSSNPDEIMKTISEQCSDMEKQLQHAVVAIQFYDRLSQRFGHIHENMHVVASMLHGLNEASPSVVDGIYEKMRSVYSLEQERHIHDVIMNGDAKKDDFDKAEKIPMSKYGDVELF